MDEHARHLEEIFTLFTSKGIAISPVKSYLGYPSVELLGFRVDAFGMSTTEERLEAFRQLTFPRQLKALEQYLGFSGFLRYLLPYYAQCAEPLQKRKTALLAEGRKMGKVEDGNVGKRQAYCRSTYYDLTPEELQSFESVQKLICDKTIFYH